MTSLTAPFAVSQPLEFVFKIIFPANRVLFYSFLFQVITLKSPYSGQELPVPGSLSMHVKPRVLVSVGW